ncbi:hypothetical protein GCM10026915_16910 [Simiduia litorea]
MSATITSAISNGDTIEISGTGFGDTSPMYFWDDVSASFNEQGGVDGKEVQVGPSYTWKKNTDQYGSPFHFRKSETLRNGKTGPVYFGEGHKNFLSGANFPTTASSHTMYVSWWYKPSEHPNGEWGSNKFIRIWDDPNGNGTRISWTQMHLTCDGESWFTWNGEVGKWNRHEFFVNLNDKRILIRINGIIAHDMTGCKKSPAYVNTPLYVQVLGFDHGAENFRSMTTMLDDIYIGENRRRFEIANSNEWAYGKSSDILEIVSWSDTLVVAKAPEGSAIHKSNTSYIYFFDSNDLNVNTKLNCPACPKM